MRWTCSLALLASVGACEPAATQPPAEAPSSTTDEHRSSTGDASYRSLDFEKMLSDFDGPAEPKTPPPGASAQVPVKALAPKEVERLEPRLGTESPAQSRGSRPPVAQTQKAEQPNTFPTAVAGFVFGMTIQESEFLCTDGLNRELGRKGLPFNTYLAGADADRYCPFAAEPVDFLRGGVSLHFVGGLLVWVTVTAESWAAAFERLSGKYGGPLYQWSGRSFVPAGAHVVPGESVAWGPAGGKIVMRSNAAHEVVFASDREEGLRNQGF